MERKRVDLMLVTTCLWSSVRMKFRAFHSDITYTPYQYVSLFLTAKSVEKLCKCLVGGDTVLRWPCVSTSPRWWQFSGTSFWYRVISISLILLAPDISVPNDTLVTLDCTEVMSKCHRRSLCRLFRVFCPTCVWHLFESFSKSSLSFDFLD